MTQHTPEATVRWTTTAPPDRHEEIIAVLAENGFYAFEEEGQTLTGYIGQGAYEAAAVKAALRDWLPDLELQAETEEIAAKDWNAEWEQNFQPVQVDDFCQILPSFKQPEPGYRHTVIIEPKMAFGTGHHETTWNMSQCCGEMDFRGKQVLDMGTGTGVLGILAMKLGAATCDAIDIDVWSYENAQENAALNAVQLNVILGGAEAIPAAACYDIILANINRNILLQDRDAYLHHLKPGGEIVLSGFFDFDAPRVQEAYEAAGLVLNRRKERNAWVLLSFIKQNPPAVG